MIFFFTRRRIHGYLENKVSLVFFCLHLIIAISMIAACEQRDRCMRLCVSNPTCGTSIFFLAQNPAFAY